MTALRQPEPAWLDTLEPPEYLIALAVRQIQDSMNTALRKHGLKLVEWRMLQCLSGQDGLTICDLAEAAVIDRTVASRLVDKLAERGLLSKDALKSDRRFAQVTLTKAGRSLLAAADLSARATRERLFTGVSEAEADMLNRTLMTLIANGARRF